VTAFAPDRLTDADFPYTFGRYELRGLLGEGGMARVFRAVLQGRGGFRKSVALKVIRARVTAPSPAMAASLENEARLGGLLHHPNIVETYDFGTVDGQLFIAMELVEGMTLSELLADGPLSTAAALEVARQIAAGLEHAHALREDGVEVGLVHRDLKPANVMIDRDGVAKVMDFGIARSDVNVGPRTMPGMSKGTPSYMAPEQIEGENIDDRADIFSFGTLLYEMLTGRAMFGGDTLMAILSGVAGVQKRLREDAEFVEMKRTQPEVLALLEGCWRIRKEERIPHAGELVREIAAAAAKHPISAAAFRFQVRERLGAEGQETIRSERTLRRARLPPGTEPDEVTHPMTRPELPPPVSLAALAARGAEPEVEADDEATELAKVPPTLPPAPPPKRRPRKPRRKGGRRRASRRRALEAVAAVSVAAIAIVLLVLLRLTAC